MCLFICNGFEILYIQKYQNVYSKENTLNYYENAIKKYTDACAFYISKDWNVRIVKI